MTRINFFLALGLAAVLCSGASAQSTNKQTVNLDGSSTSSVNLTGKTQNPTQLLPSDPTPIAPVGTTLNQEGPSGGFAKPFNQKGPPKPVPTPPSWMALGFGLIGFVTLSRKKSLAKS